MTTRLHPAAVAVLAAALLACAPAPARAAAPPVLAGINDRGAHGEGHAFELYGAFPAEPVRPIVACDGRAMQAEIMAPPLPGQINLLVEAMAEGSTCSFRIERLSDAARSAARSVVTGPVPIAIRAIADRGVTGGRRFVELHGSFAEPETLQARILCGGRHAGGRVEFASPRQINVSLPDAGPAGSCAFLLRQPGSGLASPMFGRIPPVRGALPPGFGGYFWGGVPKQAGGALAAGQGHLQATGFDATRLVVTPRMRSGHAADNYYHLDLAALNAACPLDEPFLPCAIRRPDYQAAIGAPGLRRIVLTAYDSASSGPLGAAAHYVDPEFWKDPRNRDAVRREFRDLTFALHETQKDSGKSFVLTSWEADNQAYCGSFYSYWIDEGFRARCGDIASRRRALDGIAQWFAARRDGIRAGRARARAAGYRGVTVSDGIEFNMNTLAYRYEVDGALLPSVLRDVIPSVGPDHALYSSYDSQFRGRMEQDLREIRGWLDSVAPGSALAVGEIGFPRHAVDGTDAFRTVETVKAIQRVGLPFAILWEAFDTGWVNPYGLLNGSGEARRVMRILGHELGAQAREIAAGPAMRIAAANDRGVADAGAVAHRVLELYGAFTTGALSAAALCDGVEVPIDVLFASATQVNVAMLHEGAEQRYCTLRLRHAGGGASLSFGPIVD